MLGCSIAILFSCNLFLLELSVSCHARSSVALCQLEHTVVQGMEPCQGHKLELVPQLAQISLHNAMLETEMCQSASRIKANIYLTFSCLIVTVGFCIMCRLLSVAGKKCGCVLLRESLHVWRLHCKYDRRLRPCLVCYKRSIEQRLQVSHEPLLQWTCNLVADQQLVLLWILCPIPSSEPQLQTSWHELSASHHTTTDFRTFQHIPRNQVQIANVEGKKQQHTWKVAICSSVSFFFQLKLGEQL